MCAKKIQNHRHLPAFILLTLAKGPSHGGAVYNWMIENIPGFKCDTGAIYRTLKKLEDDEAVIFEWDTTQPGPAKKIYSITEKGRTQLDDWREDIERRRTYLDYFLEEYNKL